MPSQGVFCFFVFQSHGDAMGYGINFIVILHQYHRYLYKR